MKLPYHFFIGRRRKAFIGIAFVLAAAILALALYFFEFRQSGTARTAGDGPSGQLVRAEMVANTEAVVPGKEFLLGVHFEISPKWHIYWKNPGDAGIPTTVDLELPQGFTAGPILYPDPIRFKQPGDISGYGYKDEAMLLVRVYPAADLPAGQSVTFRAHARWLSCKDICILGDQKLERQIPVALQARGQQEELFKKWMERLPSDSEPTTAAVYSPNRQE